MPPLRRREVLAAASAGLLSVLTGCSFNAAGEERDDGFRLDLDPLEAAPPDDSDLVDLDAKDVSSEARTIFGRPHSGHVATQPYSDAELGVLDLLDVPVRLSITRDVRQIRLEDRYYRATVSWITF
jgi:hypothetical protein